MKFDVVETGALYPLLQTRHDIRSSGPTPIHHSCRGLFLLFNWCGQEQIPRGYPKHLTFPRQRRARYIRQQIHTAGRHYIPIGYRDAYNACFQEWSILKSATCWRGKALLCLDTSYYLVRSDAVDRSACRAWPFPTWAPTYLLSEYAILIPIP